jgi:hypothetical protein
MGRPIEQDTDAMAMPPIVMPDTGNEQRSDPELVYAGVERAMRCVCAIDGAGSKAGTGTLIGQDLVLTNYHVVERLLGPAADFNSAECRFDYRIGKDGRLLAAGDAQTIFKIREVIICSPPSPGDIRGGGDVFDDDRLDFAIVRLDGQPGRLPDAEGNIRGWIVLPWKKDAADPDIGLEISILQHPYQEGGATMLQPLKSDFAEFVDARSDPARGAAGALARYVHDGATRRGSSGGPCFSTTYGFVFVAIHNASLDYSNEDKGRGQAIPLRRIAGFIERKTNQPGDILGRAPPKDVTADTRERQRAVSIGRRKNAALCLMDRSKEERAFLSKLFAPASGPQPVRPLLHVVVCRENDAYHYFINRLKHLTFESKPDGVDTMRLAALIKGLNPPSRDCLLDAWPQQDEVEQRRADLDSLVRSLDKSRRHLLVLSQNIDAAWSPAIEDPLLREFAKMLAEQFQADSDNIQAVVFFIVTSRGSDVASSERETEELTKQFARLWSVGAPPHCGVCTKLSPVSSSDLENWRATLETAWAVNPAFLDAIRRQFLDKNLKPLETVAAGLDDSLSRYIADTLDKIGLLKEPSP